MSLESLLQQAVTDGRLLDASLKNINALLSSGTNPVYRASIEELAEAGQWTELKKALEPLMIYLLKRKLQSGTRK